ncbi:MAG: hypothetical protein V2J07_09705 [Anaerolineae bacterium]|jgi:uncharacterized protein with HEPN domain|nr:hypothetical protein [Anaerolineae bacterium]
MTKTEKYLRDILEAIRAIESYQVASFQEFEKDCKTQDAIM